MILADADSTFAFRARETTQLLQRDTSNFIATDLWPPNSPELNRRLQDLGHHACVRDSCQ